MSFYRGFYVNFIRFARVISLLKLHMKIAFSSFRGTNHRQVLFWEGQQATKIDPNFWVASRASSLARQGRWRDQLGRQADTQMPLLQKLIPKLGICTLLLPKSPCVWPQQSAPRMKQMEEGLRPSTACQQQKLFLPGEWYHCVCVCTHQHALKPCFNFQGSSTAKQLRTRVSNDRMHLTRSSEDRWMVYLWYNGVLTRILLGWRDWTFELFYFLKLVCRGHCETLRECLCFKYMLCCSWRTKSQPAVWHSWENQS